VELGDADTVAKYWTFICWLGGNLLGVPAKRALSLFWAPWTTWLGRTSSEARDPPLHFVLESAIHTNNILPGRKLRGRDASGGQPVPKILSTLDSCFECLLRIEQIYRGAVAVSTGKILATGRGLRDRANGADSDDNSSVVR
jgi:hypothetical protein